MAPPVDEVTLGPEPSDGAGPCTSARSRDRPISAPSTRSCGVSLAPPIGVRGTLVHAAQRLALACRWSRAAGAATAVDGEARRIGPIGGADLRRRLSTAS